GSQTAGSSTVSYGTNSWIKVEQYRSGVRAIDSNQCYTVVTVEDGSVVLPASATVNGSKLKSPLTVAVGNTILRQPDGTFTTYQGVGNGVVYATSDIDNLWGTNKGRRTVVCEQNKSTSTYGTIRIGGWQNDSTGTISKSAGQKGLLAYGVSDANHDGVLDAPSTAANALGLVAYDVSVSSSLKGSGWSYSHPSNNPLYLYCSVVAGMSGRGGSYSVESYNSGGAGYAYRYGSRIQVEAGAWGTTSGHGLIMGTSYFDEASAVSPPPYFPALPTFSVVTYEDVPVFDGDHL
ncbi:MAG: hypothetical protein KC910_07945, partial [Candidatus Eremiobacteraeota bacterium]|nr:hypothetical protein [Candidatus Eremiobacteraeota bacterium]